MSGTLAVSKRYDITSYGKVTECGGIHPEVYECAGGSKTYSSVSANVREPLAYDKGTTGIPTDMAHVGRDSSSSLNGKSAPAGSDTVHSS